MTGGRPRRARKGSGPKAAAARRREVWDWGKGTEGGEDTEEGISRTRVRAKAVAGWGRVEASAGKGGGEKGGVPKQNAPKHHGGERA